MSHPVTAAVVGLVPHLENRFGTTRVLPLRDRVDRARMEAVIREERRADTRSRPWFVVGLGGLAAAAAVVAVLWRWRL